jgi:predicted aspartyl protease
VTLRVSDDTPTVPDYPAQLDTAADRTVVPDRVVAALGLLRMGEIPVMGVGGNVVVLPTFLVELTIRQLQPLVIKVVAGPDEPYVLLGRDVLNRHRILLDGPALAFEIG